MKFNVNVHYGVSFIRFLKRSQGRLHSLEEASSCLGLSKALLTQVAHALKKRGLVHSVRGVKGGYTVTKEVSFLDVIDTLDALTFLRPAASASESDDSFVGLEEKFEKILGDMVIT